MSVPIDSEYTFRRRPSPLNRQCGECSACCEVMGVDELAKPRRCRCTFQREGGGCKIYEARPPSCAGFRCLWHMGLFEENDRPDKLGVMFDAATVTCEDGTQFHVPHAKEVWPGGYLDALPVLRWIVAKTQRPIFVAIAGHDYEFNGVELYLPTIPNRRL